ncbi:hypothetical protein M408DRAFT_115979 [Serendipita vermifera MAFF 305830]|uniref:Uncharacterized protein n=1 Tax=Serendipita vermifera MAFF 305830 TaxID=933852 RepID=A0A0C3BDV4_SERVB|nr:hypothetical protein M408DRAFT_115979 [Serendipita vermifera MAFF 305830]
MQSSFDPAILTSSPLRQLYEVLTVFEAQRDWSIAARAALLDRVAARLPRAHQPDVFLLHSMLEELGVDVGSLSDLSTDEGEEVPAISRLSRSNAPAQSKFTQKISGSTSLAKTPPTLSPQLASLMTTREIELGEDRKTHRNTTDGRVCRYTSLRRLYIGLHAFYNLQSIILVNV